jgi:hypothetical protein
MTTASTQFRARPFKDSFVKVKKPGIIFIEGRLKNHTLCGDIAKFRHHIEKQLASVGITFQVGEDILQDEHSVWISPSLECPIKIWTISADNFGRQHRHTEPAQMT